MVRIDVSTGGTTIELQTISSDYLDAFIDFAPEGRGISDSIKDIQRKGTVAAFNMLATNGFAYLADEVGMGKTYVALAVMSLLRHFDPHARIIVIAPRQNIQLKWVKELKNFVRHNWKVRGNRVKSLAETPVWEPVVCDRLIDFVREVHINQDRDFFLRMTSFSIRSKLEKDRKRHRELLRNEIAWLPKDGIDINKKRFLESYSAALNRALPEADLVVVDEAHNLKHGFGDKVSTRNRVMGLTFGHDSLEGYDEHQAEFNPIAKRLLLLSATPFEDDYAAIQRQMDIFGHGQAVVQIPGKIERLCIADLSDKEKDLREKQKIVEQILIRRTASLLIGGKEYTKNMYRREWRQGGLARFDYPIRIEDPSTQLIVALMQKKVSEILQTEHFNNRFQIGMLSSFESFSQSIDKSMQSRDTDNDVTEDSNEGSTFDGSDQQANLSEEVKKGIDSNAIAKVADSFEQHFGRKLPHPKIDRVVEVMKSAFETGDKVLIFVRRIATVAELTDRFNEEFNMWVKDRMETALPNLREQIQDIFDRYSVESKREQHLQVNGRMPPIGYEESLDVEEPAVDSLKDLELQDDVGGVESFFEWFFRGQGPRDLLSGGAFQRNRLSKASSAYSTLLADNYVAYLVNVPPKGVVEELGRILEMKPKSCRHELRVKAWRYFKKLSDQAEGYAKLHVFESYQYAALSLLAKSRTKFQPFAQVVLDELHENIASAESEIEPPLGFPEPGQQLATETVFTKLRDRIDLSNRLWPSGRMRKNDDQEQFRREFRRREQLKELLSCCCRLGRAYIDLYMLAIESIGSFRPGETEREEGVSARLAESFIELLQTQRDQPGHSAFYELWQCAENFDTLIAVNFPDVEEQHLTQLKRYFGTKLSQQVPVGGMAGQVNKRLVSQFRMPGFPLILITTDVLQEGEDLHTFCKQILHYGIAWTPSALEQRTGRIDRIGGLVQRELGRVHDEPEEDDFIQVYYPHLQDTIELLQISRVLRRLNDFYKLMHLEFNATNDDESSVDSNTAMHEKTHYVEQYREPLRSAFDIKEEWLQGELGTAAVRTPDWNAQFDHFKNLCRALSANYSIEIRSRKVSPPEFVGKITIDARLSKDNDGLKRLVGCEHEFTLRLKSNVSGEETLIQCESEIDEIDLRKKENMEILQDLLQPSVPVKVCVEARIKKDLDRVFVRQEILFRDDLTQANEVRFLFNQVVPTAAKIRRRWQQRMSYES